MFYKDSFKILDLIARIEDKSLDPLAFHSWRIYNLIIQDTKQPAPRLKTGELPRQGPRG
jgi:hypothetical protein